jgi:hypothetical protein
LAGAQSNFHIKAVYIKDILGNSFKFGFGLQSFVFAELNCLVSNTGFGYKYLKMDIFAKNIKYNSNLIWT